MHFRPTEAAASAAIDERLQLVWPPLDKVSISHREVTQVAHCLFTLVL